MGRYDKIKVYDGAWKTPNSISIYTSEGWKFFGYNNSEETKPLKVFKTPYNLVTCTKHIVYNTVETDKRVVGSGPSTSFGGHNYSYYFQLLPLNGYCNYSRKRQFDFQCTVKKTDDAEANLFYSGTRGNVYISIRWLANGKIRLSTKYEGYSETSFETSNSVGAGAEVDLHIYSNASSKWTIVFNGTVTTGGNYNNFLVSNAVNYVGDYNIMFTNLFRLIGSQYSGNTQNVAEFNCTTGVNVTTYTQYATQASTPVTTSYWVDD